MLIPSSILHVLVLVPVVSFIPQPAHTLFPRGLQTPLPSHLDDNDAASSSELQDRRSNLQTIAGTLAAVSCGLTIGVAGQPESAQAMTQDANWPLWPALPVAPYSKRRTIRQAVVPGKVWTFDQLIGIYYVHVPIRMTVVASKGDGLLVYAPVAPTQECLTLVQELIDEYGPIQNIILPSVAVEHKVLAGPFARKFPDANFYITDRQYSFPLPLPDRFLGLPSWTQPLPKSSRQSPDNKNNLLLGPDFEWEVLTVKPGPGSMFQDVGLLHKSSKTLLVCDALFATTTEPPAILTQEPDYVRALLFHARDSKDDVVPDTLENRRKGWRRIVLLFNFFFPGSGRADLGVGPILQAFSTPTNVYGWGGWKPFSWDDEASEVKDFATFSANGKPTILPIIQIILARGPDALTAWVDTIRTWNFERVIPMHLDAPLKIGPKQFAETYDFLKSPGSNKVRFCDEDVRFLRAAEEGLLSFSVYTSPYPSLRGKNGPCGLLK